MEQARQHIALYDATIKDDLLAVSKMCLVEGCRKPDYHQTPFFAEEFAEKRARALVGYSESLSGALAAAADQTKCPSPDKCLKDELLLEPRIQQALPHIRFFLLEVGWYGNVAIECCQRNIVEFSRAGIETIQTMCPPADNNELAEPGLQCDDEFRECFEFGI
jgi:hypothetical protein